MQTGDPRAWRFYIGSSNNFKKRVQSHLDSFKDRNRVTESMLSEYIWKLKDEGAEPKVAWSVISKEREYNRESKRCNLCIREKLEILKHSLEPGSLNIRSELLNKCRHRNKFLLANVDTRGLKRSNPGHNKQAQYNIPQGMVSQENEIVDPGGPAINLSGSLNTQDSQTLVYERGKTRSGRPFNIQNPKS